MSSRVSCVSTHHISLVVLAALAASTTIACGGGETVAPPPKPPVVTAPPPPPAAPADPLGPKPELAAPEPFTPPTPVVFTTSRGLTVWLLERHALPVVALSFATPYGSASDPKDLGGLASATANMLDEGAGKRGPLELAGAVDQLGATLSTGATTDSSFATLTVLKRNLAQAFPLLSDVVARPRMDAKEWQRVHDLWLNDLTSRKSEPHAVSSVVSAAVLFGADHPYGHPVTGTTASAKRVSLDAVKKFYHATWRPDRATLVAVGDVTQKELTGLLDASLADWTAPKEPPREIVKPVAPQGPWPRVVVVDREDAPQSVIALVRPGLAADDADAAPLARVNVALGGSFTSRLNQDLREEHGWSYGARSRVSEARGTGSVVCSAAVFTDKTGEALGAMLADVQKLAKDGLTDEEVAKTRMLARNDLVEDYEKVGRTAARLSTDAALGLPPDHEARASVLRDAAGKKELDRLAARYFATEGASVIVVGPWVKLAPALEKLGLPKPERRDAEGQKIP